jgi:hypothetical protein
MLLGSAYQRHGAGVIDTSELLQRRLVFGVFIGGDRGDAEANTETSKGRHWGLNSE